MVYCRNCGESRSVEPLVAEEEVRPTAALHSLDAVALVLQEMMQLKYGLALDEADLQQKLRHHCNGHTPLEVVTSFNQQRDLHFRARGGQRLVALRLEQRSLSCEQLLQRVRQMQGTACAVCVIEPCRAVAVFRESYTQPSSFLGRCAGLEPLVPFKAFQEAMSLEPQVLGEVRTGPTRKPQQCGAPPWREEFSALSRQPPVPRLPLSGRRRRKDSQPSSARLTQCSTEASPRSPNMGQMPVSLAGAAFGLSVALRPAFQAQNLMGIASKGPRKASEHEVWSRPWSR